MIGVHTAKDLTTSLIKPQEELNKGQESNTFVGKPLTPFCLMINL